MAVLSELEPKKVFEYFEKLCSVPHGSYNTKLISDLVITTRSYALYSWPW